MIFLLGYFLKCVKQRTPMSYMTDIRMIGQVKLMMNFLQILSSFPVVLDVPWPENLKLFMFGLGWVNLDIFSIILGPNTCSLSLPTLDHFAIHLAILPLLMCSCIAAYRLSILCRKTSDLKSSDEGVDKSTSTSRRQTRWELTTKILMLLVLLLYPGICSKTFSIFRCKQVWESLDGAPSLYLESDFNVRCWSSKHNGRVALAVTSIIVYVVGMPCVLFILLYRNRKHLHNASSPKHEAIKFELGGLYLQFE